MRLDKLRGYGPWFAFAVPVLFLVSTGWFIAVESVGNSGNGPPAAWFDAGIALWLLLLGLFILAGLVVAIDLEWIEHPRTNTPMTYVALAGAIASAAGFFLYLLESVFTFGGGWVFIATNMLLVGGMGVYLVVMNVVGLRAGLLGRVLPWLGVVSGALFVAAALLIVSLVEVGAESQGPLLGAFEMAGLAGLLLYLAWSLWLGFRLRGRAPATARA